MVIEKIVEGFERDVLEPARFFMCPAPQRLPPLASIPAIKRIVSPDVSKTTCKTSAFKFLTQQGVFQYGVSISIGSQ
jgi:hypothetical protein